MSYLPFRPTPLAAAIGCTLVAFASVHAQTVTAPVSQLRPIAVEGQAPSSYEVPQSDSAKFTAPLLDTPRTVRIIPRGD